MYAWLCTLLPRTAVNALYCVWYAALMFLIVLLGNEPMVNFYYLHG